MGVNQHGALGSNQPLERIIPDSESPEPAAKDENFEVLPNDDHISRSENNEKLEVLSDGDDVVYLREDLRRR